MRSILIMQLKKLPPIAERKISTVLQEEIRSAVKKAQEDIDKKRTTPAPSIRNKN